MYIIGHRGASGLALENSIAAIRAGVDAGVDAVEFDIRLSKDNQFFLSHDPTLGRVSPKNISIKKTIAAELNTVELNNKEPLPSLSQALEARGKATAVIEVKGNNWSEFLAKYLKQYKPENIVIIAFNHQELLKFHGFLPGTRCYFIERSKPFEAMRKAQANGLTGIDLNFWLLNPFTYWYSKILKLDLIIYTVNWMPLAWYFRMFFPSVAMTTDVPHKMQHLRR